MLRFYMTVQVTKKGEPVWAPREDAGGGLGGVSRY